MRVNQPPARHPDPARAAWSLFSGFLGSVRPCQGEMMGKGRESGSGAESQELCYADHQEWLHLVSRRLARDQCICRHQDSATGSPALIRVSQEVSYLAPVTQTLSKPCYFARTESENCMTHKTENWRVFSPLSPGRAQAINRNNEAVMRSDSTDITRAPAMSGGTPSRQHPQLLRQVQTFCSNISHKHTKRIYWLHFTSSGRSIVSV